MKHTNHESACLLRKDHNPDLRHLCTCGLTEGDVKLVLRNGARGPGPQPSARWSMGVTPEPASATVNVKLKPVKVLIEVTLGENRLKVISGVHDVAKGADLREAIAKALEDAAGYVRAGVGDVGALGDA